MAWDSTKSAYDDILSSDWNAMVTAQKGQAVKIAVLSDTKSQNTGAQATSAGWNVRDINTEDYDSDSIVSISSNRFTLSAGKYLIYIVSPQYYYSGSGTYHVYSKLALYNYSDSAYVFYGFNSGMMRTGAESNISAFGWVTISSEKSFEVRHYLSDTGPSFGLAQNVSGLNEIYLQVVIQKVG